MAQGQLPFFEYRRYFEPAVVRPVLFTSRSRLYIPQGFRADRIFVAPLEHARGSIDRRSAEQVKAPISDGVRESSNRSRQLVP
jgi:hypothetical protein